MDPTCVMSRIVIDTGWAHELPRLQIALLVTMGLDVPAMCDRILLKLYEINHNLCVAWLTLFSV